jgi:GNAT superfamily N-acetyltransferase
MHIRHLTPTPADAYRALMLQAYATEPEAFTATVPERRAQPMDWWAARVTDRPDAAECVLGAFVSDQLVGVAGLRFEQRERTKHKATLFGMFVQPPFRGQGIACALPDAQAALGTARR